MKHIINMLLTLVCLLNHLDSSAKPSGIPLILTKQPVDWSSPETNQAIQDLAIQIIKTENPAITAKDRLLMMSLQDNHQQVIKLVSEVKETRPFANLHIELLSQARLHQTHQSIDFESAFKQIFATRMQNLTDQQIHQVGWHQGYNINQGIAYLNSLIGNLQQPGDFDEKNTLQLISAFQNFKVYSHLEKVLEINLNITLAERYIIEEDVLIRMSSGAYVSATLVRKRSLEQPLATALMSNIYTNQLRNKWTAINAANHGYVGMVSDTRGKRLSPNKIEPYVHDGKDTHDVIGWISKQKWSDGQVGMYGGSYSGFVQWAAAEYHHPALKTIVPYVAAIPGQGLPMENNVFITANYAWPFYVTNNKYLDNELYYDNNRWQQLSEKWYQSGRSFREIDQVDGLANPWLQEWLDHPAYDAYWQEMVPFKNEFKHINIPVLSVTGYYDDGQISALHYLREHEKYNSNLNHYLLIGPYDHFGAQGNPAKHLRGYEIDPVAEIDIEVITFEWLDHVMKGGKKPQLLKNKVNYQMMGSNQWLHAPSLSSLNMKKQRLFFSNTPENKYHHLSTKQQKEPAGLTQKIDLNNRNSSHNSYYPWPIIKPVLDVPNGLAFITDEFTQDYQFSGNISGKMFFKTNKKDLDLGLIVYEVMPDGKTFHLGYYLGRASYAKDMTHRQLLKPNEIESFPFERSRMVSKLITKGSRIAVLVNINKNSGAQINYGTGKDVSDESASDGEIPLNIEWFNSSYIDLPLKPMTAVNN